MKQKILLKTTRYFVLANGDHFNDCEFDLECCLARVHYFSGQHCWNLFNGKKRTVLVFVGYDGDKVKK